MLMLGRMFYFLYLDSVVHSDCSYELYLLLCIIIIIIITVVVVVSLLYMLCCFGIQLLLCAESESMCILCT